MKTIHKWSLGITDEQLIRMPRNAELLTVGVQDGIVQLWGRVDTDEPAGYRSILIVGTGGPCRGDTPYIGTVHSSGQWFFWHVFDGGDQ